MYKSWPGTKTRAEVNSLRGRITQLEKEKEEIKQWAERETRTRKHYQSIVAAVKQAIKKGTRRRGFRSPTAEYVSVSMLNDALAGAQADGEKESGANE